MPTAREIIETLVADNDALTAEVTALRASKERLRVVAINANVLRQNCGYCRMCHIHSSRYMQDMETSLDLAIANGDLDAPEPEDTP